jgi:colanic acid/amylovoran biosynthesis glycosyltransferase
MRLGAVDPVDRCVVVWRDAWLPASETFILNQIASLDRWHPLLLGLRTVLDGLPVFPAKSPFGDGRVERIARKTSSLMSYRFVYDGLIHRSRASLIHAHFGTDAVTVLPIARRLRLPLIVTFHGYDATSAPHLPNGVGDRYRSRLRPVFEYASRLIAVSEYIASSLRSLGAPADKITVAPIGIPVDFVAPQREERRGITFVGRLTPIKGVADLIQAVSRLPRECLAGHPLRIVGYGPEEERLREQASRLGVSVEFLGLRGPGYIAELLSRSSIFCAPSRTTAEGAAEGFGTVNLEAALQGTPVVAYRSGGVPEAVIDGCTGLLAPNGDVAHLSRNLLRLLENPTEAISLGAAGQQRVLTQFDIRSRSVALETIYDEVTSRA